MACCWSSRAPANVAHRSLRDRAIQIRVRVAGIQPDGLAAIVNGVLIVAQPQLRVSAGVQRQRESRIDLDRLSEGLHRFLEILLFGQVAALPVEPIGVARSLRPCCGLNRRQHLRSYRYRCAPPAASCGGLTLSS